ncbi:hypothetical protein RJ640_002031 [Escallonia rubra]|uniref:TIR domain-containing protein n=1 Tax=Escallonia rubra TaxID=112253 RepID=A0AA88RH34_9ASTE|nr:hypothetical protein RJ640_002031 [Escallonia rubra]
MADVRARETSCFTSLCTYDVFLSFRGADTRKTFTDHLYTALVGVGFRTFRDDNEIERGENINSELGKAILQSRSSIIIISRNYASSRWCLDELVLILEQRRAKGHAILPIFYHVDPSKVRMQTGSFGKALSRHEKRFEEEADDRKKVLMERVKAWRSALKEVADMGGMVLRNHADGSELQFIQKIVNVIEDKVNRTILSIAPYLIGIDSRAKNINLWLQNQSNDVNILAICGMGGIGKTTIAKYLFSLNFERFECSSFLSSVRETSRQPDGLIRLQRKLLSDILKGKKKKIRSLDEGAMMIKDAVYCKKVLIILDDVDQMDQLDAILGMRGWFNPGSKIIITTRQKELLKASEVCKAHEVDKLSSRESLELFSWHAFGQDHPLKHYMDISEMVVHHCGGLPLALQILGSSLSGKTLEVWESALEKLKAIPESQILQKLKISYNSLQDDHDKNLFLDISCFFVGKDIDYIISILDGCGFFAKIGVDNLIGMCLVSVDQYNKLMMHQSVQDMGREIIRQESKKEPGKRSRVWQIKDASNVLGENTGTETVEGLSLNFHASYGNKLFESCSNTFKSKRPRSEDLLDRAALLIEGLSLKRRCLGFLSWLPIDSAIIRPFSRADEIDLEAAAFSRMQRLRLLQLSNVRLSGGYEEFPKKLRWLCWRGFPLRTIPFDFPMENLVVLDMRNSSLVQVWKGTKVLRSLKIINLSHSHGLTITPNFLEFPNLERLILKDCINLLEVHESIEILGRLVLLNLKGCKNLRKLPRRFSQLKSLETLILSGCSMLDELPMELGEMESLTVLCADGTTISGLPSTTCHLKNVLNSSTKLMHSIFWDYTNLVYSALFFLVPRFQTVSALGVQVKVLLVLLFHHSLMPRLEILMHIRGRKGITGSPANGLRDKEKKRTESPSSSSCKGVVIRTSITQIRFGLCHSSISPHWTNPPMPPGVAMCCPKSISRASTVMHQRVVCTRAVCFNFSASSSFQLLASNLLRQGRKVVMDNIHDMAEILCYLDEMFLKMDSFLILLSLAPISPRQHANAGARDNGLLLAAPGDEIITQKKQKPVVERRSERSCPQSASEKAVSCREDADGKQLTIRDRETSCFTSLCTYDVFLSFRGADTRKTFTDHLYTALVGVGFRTFRDDNEIERGENINSELEKAILQSRSSIIIISRNYASSRWCLDELVLILEQRRAKGHAILPIFYHVDPSKVRMQMGTFGKALSKHEKRFEEEADDKKKLLMDRVKVWRSALKEVADMGGMVLRKYDDGSELKFIQKIVNVIEDKVNRTILSIAPYLIGINSRAKNINLWLQNQSNDVNILAICGMGGIGKTTVAKYVFSLNFENFECSSFLSSVRETSRQPDGLIRLQRKLLSDILKGKKKKIGSLDEGAMMIKDAIYCKKVLIIFDDVDQMDQLDAILGTRGWFNPGSKIIITTRQKELLKAHEVCKVHEVDKLSSRESLELFSWHAFGQDHPLKHYTDISEMVVHHCGGLPLALQVLGSSLSGKTLEVWESALEKLKAIPESQILQKLKISYNSLQDDHDKNLFLDIACFFVGKDIDYIITILDGCGFFAKIGVDNLIGRYLVSVDQYNKLMMHQSLQDMGREIIRQESKKEPGKRSRVWHLKDASNVLGEKTGTETIEGLSLNFHASYGNKLFESCSNAFKSKRHRSEDLLDRAALLIEGISFKRRCLGFLSWLPIDSAIIRPFSRAHEIDLDTAAFSRMQRLRLLQLSNVRLNGGYEEFPKKLRWLCWRGFPLRTIPFDFPAENLVVLDMRNSSLVQVWKGTKVLRSLKIINLSHSHGLTITPNFLELPNLERLILKDCINLLEVHESIEILGRLVLLNLKGCKNLRKLPRRFSQLKSLETLILSGCSMLDELPMELGEMESLSVLCADGTTISGLPSITSHSKNVLSASAKLVNSLFWSWVSPTKNPKSTSFSLAKLPSCLTKLDLENCQLTDDIMPVDLSQGALSFAVPSLVNAKIRDFEAHKREKRVYWITSQWVARETEIAVLGWTLEVDKEKKQPRPGK